MHEITTWSDAFAFGSTNHGGSSLGFDATGTHLTACYRERVGVSNPYWKEQVREGLLASTPFFGRKQNVYEQHGGDFIVILKQDGNVTHVWRSFGFWTAPTVPSPKAYSLDLQKRTEIGFLKKVQAEINSYQVGEDAYEFRQMVDLVKNPAYAIRRETVHYLTDVEKHLRKAKTLGADARRVGRRIGKNLIATTDAIRQSYLEYQFAVKPLAASIDDAATAIIRKTSDFYPPRKVIKEVKREVTWDSQSTTYQVDPDWWREHKFATLNNETCAIMGIVNLTIAADEPRWRAELGLTPRDFLPTIWNCIPWSFVVDYFVNIGDFLNAISYTSRVGASYCTKRITRVKHYTSAETHLRPPAGNAIWSVLKDDNHSYKSRSHQVDRNPFIFGWIPPIVTRFPTMGQGLNILALLPQIGRIRNLARSLTS